VARGGLFGGTRTQQRSGAVTPQVRPAALLLYSCRSLVAVACVSSSSPAMSLMQIAGTLTAHCRTARRRAAPSFQQPDTSTNRRSSSSSSLPLSRRCHGARSVCRSSRALHQCWRRWSSCRLPYCWRQASPRACRSPTCCGTQRQAVGAACALHAPVATPGVSCAAHLQCCFAPGSTCVLVCTALGQRFTPPPFGCIRLFPLCPLPFRTLFAALPLTGLLLLPSPLLLPAGGLGGPRRAARKPGGSRVMCCWQAPMLTSRC
jgi:hypothetical protein